MIVYAAAYPFLLLFDGLLALWPTAGSIGPTSDGLFVQYLRGMQAVVDIAGPLYFLSGLLLAVPAMLAVRCAVYVYRLTPGKFS